ncbi:MAG: flagellar protein FlgJ [Gammaproteobacteria bacterium]|jgi:flagellar protein FlgJ
MTSETDFYLDFNRFAGLKAGARNQSAEATQSVAEQFEGLFMQQMLSSMRAAAVVDTEQHSSYTDFYRDMYDKQLAQTSAKQGGLGIARMITQQISGPADVSIGDGKNLSDYQGVASQSLNRVLQKSLVPNPAIVETLPTYVMPEYEDATAFTLSNSNYQTENSAVQVKAYVDNGSLEPGINAVAATFDWRKPEQFVQDVLPNAVKAAEKLGISAEALVAQSALETGWGKHVIRLPDGQPSFNLFGIKTGSNWDGDSVTKATLEYRNGVLQTETAQFRAYSSLADGFEDYVDFIQSRSRYQSALQHEGDVSSYFHGLQNAGYATDPEYANKILSILNGEILASAISAKPAESSTSEGEQYA